MKISIIGAGNVGGLTAMRLAQENLGDILLVDIAKGLAVGKAFDLEDARAALNLDYKIEGSQDIEKIKGSGIVIVTAGLARKPGMTREELLKKNAQIVKDICLKIKELTPHTIVLIVTNPLDLITYLALKTLQFKPHKVFGVGVNLDASRFTNLISKELNIPIGEIEAFVIGTHGEGMLPLPRLTKIKGESLDNILNKEKIQELVKKTIERGAKVVSLLGSGSAYFAPSAAVREVVQAIIKDEKRILGACAYLNGEYGLRDICMGVPCRIGKEGISEIIKLDLNPEEKAFFLKAAPSLKNNLATL
jgi:malate dehydrogenase